MATATPEDRSPTPHAGYQAPAVTRAFAILRTVAGAPGRLGLSELAAERGAYSAADAQRDIELVDSIAIDHTKELSYYEKKTVHNLKYYTWIEQQGREVQELNDQWYDHDNYWYAMFDQVHEIDALINQFNERVGLL